MEEKFIELKPGYLIPISAIQVVQWKDEKLLIAYDKAGTSTTIEVENIRDSAVYLYERIRRLAVTFEMGPGFVPEDHV